MLHHLAFVSWTAFGKTSGFRAAGAELRPLRAVDGAADFGADQLTIVAAARIAAGGIGDVPGSVGIDDTARLAVGLPPVTADAVFRRRPAPVSAVQTDFPRPALVLGEDALRWLAIASAPAATWLDG
jgi:hypothetical protein